MSEEKKVSTELSTVSNSNKNEPEKPKNRKLMIGLGVIIMLIAIALVIGIFLRNHAIQEEIHQLTDDLNASQTRWQTIAEDKENLQEELNTLVGNIREAKLTLLETENKSADLKEQIASLTDLNAALSEQLELTDQKNSMLRASMDELESKAKMLSNASAVLTDQMEKRNGATTGGLWAGLSAARLSMLDVWKFELSALKEERESIQNILAAMPQEGFETRAGTLNDRLYDIEQQINDLEKQILQYDTQVD